MVAADGRWIGRNRDADAIVNTLVVSFAQLKIDNRQHGPKLGAIQRRPRKGGSRLCGSGHQRNKIATKLHINLLMEEARKELVMIETANCRRRIDRLACSIPVREFKNQQILCL